MEAPAPRWDALRGPALPTIGLLFLIAAALALPWPPPPGQLAFSTLLGAACAALGLAAEAALARAGVLPGRGVLWLNPRALLLSLLAGAVVGGALLALLLRLARVEPALAYRLAARAHDPPWRPVVLAIESSILEEVFFRLFLLSALAWLTARLLRRAPATVPFAVALALSSLAFGLAHLPAWLAAVRATPLLVGSVLALNGAGGALLGWVYWRWGLAHAIACHVAADLVIQGLGPRLIGGG